jgi:nitroreductase
MDVIEAIRNRRSIGKMKPDPVGKEKIEQLLDAAVWAPNHKRTEPWRFFVMTGEGRRVLGKAYADIARTGLADPYSEASAFLLKKQEEKAYRAPVIIGVAASPSEDPSVIRAEELAAVHASVQNILLTAEAIGLAAIWRTGEPAYHPLMKEAFHLSESDQMVGLVYVGYPDSMVPVGSRTSFQQKTVWLETI